MKFVIFDLDETIVNNEIPFGEMRDRILAKIKSEDKPKHLYEYLKEKNEKYLKILEEEEVRRAKKARIVKSLPKVLEYLKREGIKRAVLTRNSKNATSIALGSYADEFDAIITRDDGFEPKPSDEAIRYLLDKFRVKNEECIVVGDYDYDIIAGKRAGCVTVGVRMDKGDYRIEDIGEIVDIISRLNAQKIHLIYRRIPNEVIERDDVLIEDLGDTVIAKTKFRGMKRPLIVDGEEVIKNGYTMLYFAFIGKNYDILKIYDGREFKGIYVDVLKYTRRYGNTIEMLDLFLDIFISPSGKWYILDEDELQKALDEGLIDTDTYNFAYREAREIIENIKLGKFPPEIVMRVSEV